jgi:hypothetical protein
MAELRLCWELEFVSQQTPGLVRLMACRAVCDVREISPGQIEAPQ